MQPSIASLNLTALGVLFSITSMIMSFILFEFGIATTSFISGVISPASMRPARRASSTSWLRYARESETRTTQASIVVGLLRS